MTIRVNPLRIASKEQSTFKKCGTKIKHLIDVGRRAIRGLSPSPSLVTPQGDILKAFDLRPVLFSAMPNESRQKAASLFKQGIKALDSREREAALIHLEGALRLEPDNKALEWFMLGVREYLTNDGTFPENLQKALEHFNKALILDPLNADYLSFAGDFYCHTGREEEGMDMLKKAVAIDPRCFHAWYSMAFILRGKDRVESMACLLKAHAVDPDHAQVLGWIGSVLEKPEEAIYYLIKATEAEPNYSTLWLNRGSCHFQLNELDRADESYAMAIKLHPKDQEAWIMRGRIAHKKKDRAQSLRCFDRAIAIADSSTSKNHYPLNPMSCLLAAEILGRSDLQKELEAAIIYLDRAIGLKFNPLGDTSQMHALMLGRKGKILEKLGRHEDAAECYAEAQGLLGIPLPQVAFEHYFIDD